MRKYRPNCIITTRILHTSGITFFSDIEINILHEQIGCQDSVHEVATDVEVVEIILKERRNLLPVYKNVSNLSKTHGRQTSAEHISIEQSSRSLRISTLVCPLSTSRGILTTFWRGYA